MFTKPPGDLAQRIRQAHRSGDEGGEREAAELSTWALTNVSDGVWAPNGLEEALDEAAECMWDGPYSDPLMVFQAVMGISQWARFAERHLPLKDPVRLRLRSSAMTREARAWHMRGPQYDRTAFAAALQGVVFLEGVAGGPHALRDIIARPMANPVAELAVALLPIYFATLRRAGLAEEYCEFYMRLGLELVEPYLLRWNTVQRPALYPRTPALAAQVHFALCERRRPQDQDLIRALYDLDAETRPNDARGQATRALRDLAFAKYSKRLDDAERHRLSALEALDPRRMPRHFKIIEYMGFLKPIPGLG